MENYLEAPIHTACRLVRLVGIDPDFALKFKCRNLVQGRCYLYKFELIHLGFTLSAYVNLIRLGPSVSEDIVLRELGIDPLETLRLTRAARCWNMLVQSPQRMIRKMTLLSEVIDAQHERCSK